MQAIIGLGNPGKKYTGTRHNVGFFILDYFQKKLNLPPFALNKKIRAKISKNRSYLLSKPQTFMNRSGRSVQALLLFYKIPHRNLWLIHDDIDIPLGQFKIQRNRSAAGHQGVQSVIQSLGTQDFQRIRAGIGALGPKKIPTEKFVLQCFTPSEQKKINAIRTKIFKAYLSG